ncbi:hypothetical protein NUSPORA_00585 [Nucleospora cyclopteri]
MRYFTPNDIYDNIIPTIQSFPMEIYYFKRNINRVDAVLNKCRHKLDKIIKKLPKLDKGKLDKISAKIERAYEKKEKLLIRLQNAVESHLNLFNKLNELANSPINTDIQQMPQNISYSVTIEDVPENKRVYCSCQTMASGKMICCDNSNCEIGWYHLKCVGLIKAPKTKWICMRCLEK